MDLTQPVVATCGSGVTAAVIALAAHSLNTTIPLYDVNNTLPSSLYGVRYNEHVAWFEVATKL